ncbi:conserved hypothetical protein [Verticillium alfalfae VaMs.102]|uniref:RING-type E3 ubiquitin transferase n=1 Tax=Verticillium alfalfae (strain VaMs.102 / ATCC MYA-4576 / FGSC 10136) TaxID=526221 RepID=C9SEN5_VERA1|nr:conserved hypothetical protein [Verticillium alfalfae VaMs.102]EEY16628.1 conserved hypothetical protein [Verticillium alfalfae VaMs.102]
MSTPLLHTHYPIENTACLGFWGSCISSLVRELAQVSTKVIALRHAVRAVLRRGWLDPDAGVLTRAFVIPGLFVGGLALFGPAYGASLLEARGMLGSPGPAPHELKMVYRLAYPAAAFSALAAVLLWSVLGVFHSWKVRIRDEAYLIGERLHNFGMGTVGATAGRAQWRGARDVMRRRDHDHMPNDFKLVQTASLTANVILCV